MKKLIVAGFLCASALSAQVQIGKNVQIGGTGAGGATLPTGAIVYGLSSTTSRATLYSDIVPLWSGCAPGTPVLRYDGTCSAGGGSGGPNNFPGTTHQFVTSYNSGALNFSGAQPAFTDISGIATVAQGGTGTSSPGIVAGTNVTVTGTWPNQTVNSTGGGGGCAIGTCVQNTGPSTQTVTQALGTTLAVNNFNKIVYSNGYATIELAVTACNATFPCHIIVSSTLTQSTAGTYQLPAGVFLEVKAGGRLTRSGQTLDFSLTDGTVVAGAYDIGFGTGTVTNLNGDKVEWFGAKGDGVLSTGAGTDATTAIQAAVTALRSSLAVMGPYVYKVSGTINISTNFVGLAGTQYGYPSVSSNGPTILMATSATATIINVTGIFDTVKNVSLQRIVLPTSGAIGLNAAGALGLTLSYVQSEDSIKCFQFQNSNNSLGTSWEHLAAGQGFLTVSGYTGNIYGFYFDQPSTGEDTAILDNITYAASAGGAVSYGMYINGGNINDIDAANLNFAQMSYGIYINYTGVGVSDSDTDIHINFPTLDACQVSCLYVNNVLAAGPGAVNVTNGYFESAVPGVKLIDIENSSGVAVVDSQILDFTASGASTGVYANGSKSLVLAGNTFQGFAAGAGTALAFAGTSNSSVTGNTVALFGGGGANHIMSFTGTSTNNAITGNSATGAGNGTAQYLFDGTSLANDFVGNSCSTGAGWTSCLSGVVVGTAPSALGAGSTVNGVAIGASGSGITGLTANYIPKAGSATTLTANSHLDDGVTVANTITNTESNSINLTGVALPTLPTGTIDAAANVSGTSTRRASVAFGAVPFFSVVAAGGTAAAPTAITATTQIGGINGWAYNGTTYNGPIASLRIFANENQTSIAAGSYADIATTPNGSTTLTQVLKFENDGGMTTPSVTGGDKGVGTLNAAGLYAGGVAVGVVGSGLNQFASTTSAQLAGVLSDETGTGLAVFNNGPTLIAPALGTPASGVMTNVTGTATGLTSGSSNALQSATTTVNTSSATAPTNGQVLTATSGTTATWQTPAAGGTPAYPLTVTGAVSGGVVYANSTTQLTVSPAGTVNTLMKWGGAGAAPATSAITDNGTTVTNTEALVQSNKVTLNQQTTTNTDGFNINNSAATRNFILGYDASSVLNFNWGSTRAATFTGTATVANAWTFTSALTGSASVSSPLYLTATNCSSAASPAVCGSAASGSAVVAAAATTVVVNTTAVTANSQIQLTFDSSLGTKLSVTCNTTPSQVSVSARTAGTSFTVTTTAPITNPACFSYTITN